MKKIVKEYTVYTFNELSESAKERAVENLWDINIDHDWWDYIESELNEYGAKLIEFDTYRQTIKLEILSPETFAQKILENHGHECETYKVSDSFLKTLRGCQSGHDPEEYEEGEYCNHCDDIIKEYIYEIQQEYLTLLRHEYEYLISAEAIIETIEANEYEFLEDGSLH